MLFWHSWENKVIVTQMFQKMGRRSALQPTYATLKSPIHSTYKTLDYLKVFSERVNVSFSPLCLACFLTLITN